jgi:hypothetical protein
MAEYHPLNRDEAITLAALRAQIQIGDQNFRKMPQYDGHVRESLPSIVINQNPGLSKLVENAHVSFKGHVADQCIKHYLEVVQQWPYHASKFFSVVQQFEPRVPQKILMAINARGIQFFCNYEKVIIINSNDLGTFHGY